MIKPEDLAHWYLRLNGFFTITNFVVHPTRRGSQLTDGDIVGIRFPYRAEFPDGPGADEGIFKRLQDHPYFLIAEVKRGVCELNTSWRENHQEKGSALLALVQDLGPFPSSKITAVTSALLQDGCYSDEHLFASLFFVGTRFAPSLPPNAPKRTWADLLAFIFARFGEHRRIKADHEQWDPVGQELWRHFTCAAGQEAFIAGVKASCGIT